MSGKQLRRTAGMLACVAAGALATAAPSLAGETAVGLTTDAPSGLVTFPLDAPGSAQSAAITFPMGTMDTNLVGLDYRPRSNQLYAYGSLGTLYVLNPPAAAGGAWTAVQISAGLGAFPMGADTGLDFNPMADAIRVVNEANENYRFNPLTGGGGAGTAAAGKDAALNPGDPNVVAAGYTNNFDGTTATELFDIDSGSDMLFKQNPPNAGTLEPRGMLGVNTTDNAGFDVAQGSRIAYAALELAGSPGSSVLHTVDLATGTASARGPIGGGKVVESLSVVPASVISFPVQTWSVRENAGQAEIAVVRSGPENRTATVDYSVSGGGPTGTLTFAPGDAIETFTVPVSDDGANDADETRMLTLANGGANALVGANGTATLTIVDDDDRPVPPGSPPGQSKPERSKAGIRLGRAVLARGEASLNAGGAGRARLDLTTRGKRALRRALERGEADSVTLRLRVR